MKPRPKTSPYAGPNTRLQFNGSSSLYYVPKIFLKDQSCFKGDDYFTINISQKIGHVLVHYLFTGEYQILEIDESKNAKDKTLDELRLAVQVFLALQKWNFPGLQVLAQLEIESLCNSVDFFDLVRIMDEELKERVVIDEEWLRNFLIQNLNMALEENEKLIEDSSLLNELQNIGLVKLFANHLLKTCHSRNLELQSKIIKLERSDSQDTISESPEILTPCSTSSEECKLQG